LEKQRLQEENTAHLENLSNLKKIGEENEKRLAETDTKLAEAEGNQKQTSVENHDLKEKLDSLNSELKAQQAATDQLKLDHSQILSQNQERVTQFETQINDLNGEKVKIVMFKILQKNKIIHLSY
jgi:chromosome segregation ATPase